MLRKTRIIEGREFWLVGSPEIQRTADGNLAEYTLSVPEDQRVNAHAAGPFCKFGLAAAPRAPGVYTIYVNDELKYIGRCENLESRFSSTGYGLISPRNIHNDGQSTNCKLNSKVLAVAKTGGLMEVWFHTTPEFVDFERTLIETLAPEWNCRVQSDGSGTRTGRTPGQTLRVIGKSVQAKPAVGFTFDHELQRLMESASDLGHSSVEVTAAELHNIVGGYPGQDHRMPVCCARMRAAMKAGDRILHAPPKGNGASVRISYLLPRSRG